MISIPQKAKENISLTVSLVCFLISALWTYYHATCTAGTPLAGFYVVMWGISLPFGGMFIGPYAAPAAPAVSSLVGFFSASNYLRSDRPALRRISAVTLILQGVLLASIAVFILLSLT
ncbi:MAG: hypothetical protein IJD38_03405 [Clostridia bacterium]|nr:hypothetical protein [Clostridia bacterium]